MCIRTCTCIFTYIRIQVTSHLNPWFGGAVVPFNCTLNFSDEPNVVFEAEVR